MESKQQLKARYFSTGVPNLVIYITCQVTVSLSEPFWMAIQSHHVISLKHYTFQVFLKIVLHWKGFVSRGSSVLFEHLQYLVNQMKLPYAESDHWSIRVSIVYSDCQQLSRLSGQGFSCHLLPDH